MKKNRGETNSGEEKRRRLRKKKREKQKIEGDATEMHEREESSGIK